MLCDDIVSLALEGGGGRQVGEVIIGLGFTLVFLDDGSPGLAYTLREELRPGCDAFEQAGQLRGRPLAEVVSWVGGGSLIASSVGLAAVNAALRPPEEAFGRDLLGVLELRPGERVVTVGRFLPMEPKLAEAGVRLAVIERGESYAPLEDSDVVLLTATTMINGSIEAVLENVRGAREVVVLGASTPYAPSAFASTPVTRLAGSAVLGAEKVRAVVSEGGGIRTMGRALGKWVSGSIRR